MCTALPQRAGSPESNALLRRRPSHSGKKYPTEQNAAHLGQQMRSPGDFCGQPRHCFPRTQTLPNFPVLRKRVLSTSVPWRGRRSKRNGDLTPQASPRPSLRQDSLENPGRSPSPRLRSRSPVRPKGKSKSAANRAAASSPLYSLEKQMAAIMQMLTRQQRHFTELESRMESQRLKAEPVECVNIMDDEDNWICAREQPKCKGNPETELGSAR